MNHKQLLFNLLFLLLPAFMWAQQPPAYITGQVTNVSSGLPVVGATVFVYVDSLNGFPGYYNSVITDGNGGFNDTVWFNNVVPTATIEVSTSNCNGMMLSQTFNYVGSGAPSTFTANFTTNCVGGGGASCMASFAASNTGNNSVQFTNTSVGSNPNNPLNCIWDFGNGATSSVGSPSVTYAAPGTYMVCLVITDTATNCMDSVCQVVTVGSNSYNVINVTATATPGGVFAADSFMVWLIDYDSLAGTLTAIDSAIAFGNGGLASCSFANLGAGDYLVKAAVYTVNSPNYATSVPTYYTNGMFWSVATNVAVPSNNPINVQINMIQGVNPGGPGFIGGLVSQGANKTGIPHVEIILLDMSDNPITYTYSNATGSFTFPNLAYGTYKVYAEVLGKPTTPAIVTISAGTPSIGDVEVQINSTYVSTAIHQAVYFENNVKLYPNPTANIANVEVDLKQNTHIEVEVSNIFGQLVHKVANKYTSGNHTISLDTNNWNSGVYFVKVIANGTESEVQKLIVE